MQVLKVELEGVTTSFRYPHFLVGRQPSFTLPPPATIYGHIASALGELPDPATLRFGYSFSCAGRSDDLESQHIVERSSGKLDKKWGYVKNLEGNINPALREVLLWPRLTLYVASATIDRYYQAFRQPRYAVVLGRSQDLATYTAVEVIELVEQASGYFEGTLLPTYYRTLTDAGVLTQMPRYINPDNRREVEWEMYLAIEKLVVSDAATRLRPGKADPSGPARFWIDPGSPVKRGHQRIIWLHDFVPARQEV